MLKIKDSAGKVVGVLKDEDSEPEMVEKKKEIKLCQCKTQLDAFGVCPNCEDIVDEVFKRRKKEEE